jgi:hypothetical protein
LPDFIHVEDRGERVMLTWTNRPPHASGYTLGLILTVFPILVVSLCLFAPSILVAPIRAWREAIPLLIWVLGCGMVILIGRAGLRYFWTEALELTPDEIRITFDGPLAPRSRSFPRSRIVDIRVSAMSDDEMPMLKLTHGSSSFQLSEMLAYYLRTEHQKALETYLRAWFGMPPIKEDAKGLDIEA